jgi:hypothetical protein
MTLKKYLNLMSIWTLIAWLCWLAAMFFINPAKTGWFGFLVFYLSLFLAITGTVTIFSFLIAARRKKIPIFVAVNRSFWQGVWLATLVVVVLLLQGLKLLQLWNLVVFVVLWIIVRILMFLRWRRQIYIAKEEIKQ